MVKPKNCSVMAFFGIYLHSLSVHAPVQYELVCLRSLNTENQERIFQQAKQIAKSTTNQQPGNVIPAIILRLQAKQLTGDLSPSMDNGDTRVQKAAEGAPSFSGTEVNEDFLEGCTSSWQAHLERISSFLVYGPGLWWDKVPNGYKFFDGDEDDSFRQPGPPLLHFRSASLNEMQVSRKALWERLLREDVTLPAKSIKMFDQHGNMRGWIKN